MLNDRFLAVFGGLLLVCWVVVPIMFMSPSSAMAAGGSASDSQYQDPLADATSTSPVTTTSAAVVAHTPSPRVTTTPTATTTAGGAITTTGRLTSSATVSSTPKGTPSNAGSTDTLASAPSTLSQTAPASVDGGSQASTDGTSKRLRSLPMTGLNLVAVAVVGLLLFAAGLILRRRTARPLR